MWRIRGGRVAKLFRCDDSKVLKTKKAFVPRTQRLAWASSVRGGTRNFPPHMHGQPMNVQARIAALSVNLMRVYWNPWTVKLSTATAAAVVDGNFFSIGIASARRGKSILFPPRPLSNAFPLIINNFSARKSLRIAWKSLTLVLYFTDRKTGKSEMFSHHQAIKKVFCGVVECRVTPTVVTFKKSAKL